MYVYFPMFVVKLPVNKLWMGISTRGHKSRVCFEFLPTATI